MMFQLALRNIFRHGLRAAITLFAIAFGCGSLIFVSGYMEDTISKMRDGYIRGFTGHLQISRKGYGSQGRRRPFDFLIQAPDAILSDVATLPGVSVVTPRLSSRALLSSRDLSVSCLLIGVVPEKEKSTPLGVAVKLTRNDPAMLFGTVVESGEPLKSGKPDEIILGRGLAKGMNAKPGDNLTLMTATTNGSINALDVAVRGVFFSASKAYDDHVARVTLPMAQKLLRTAAVQSLVVTLDDTDATEKTKQRLEQLIAERRWDLEVKTWSELNDTYEKTKLMFSRMFFVLKLVIVIIVLLSIYNTVNMSVLERTNEIGTLLAIGKRRNDVLRLLLLEGAFIGVIGGTLGILAGGLSTWAIGRIGILMPPAPGTTNTWISEPVVVGAALGWSFTMAVAASIGSSFIPAFHASRLGIAEALRRVN